MNSDMTKIEDCLEILGKSKEVKRFLLAMLLVSKFHLTSRPISPANDIFFHRIAQYCDKLLSLLLQPDWPELLPEIEVGLKKMEFVENWSKSEKPMSGRGQQFKKDFYTYFSSINVSWSHLTPVDNLTIKRWSNPSRILIAFGPNIGIGDELIFYRAARRLAKHYPECKIEVASFSITLWDNCPFVSNVMYPVENQLAPFIRAKELIKEHENNFVVFVEFATAPLYRNLELVSGFNRFVYLDTGSRVARIVDQDKEEIFEINLPLNARVYETLSKFLDGVGLQSHYDESGYEPPIRNRAKTKPAGEKKIFVNPFSSKDYKRLTTDWWAHLIKLINSEVEVEIVIFAGINDNSRAFANEIAVKLSSANSNVTLHGKNNVPAIKETLETAIDCDLVLGLDTFTAHVNVIQSTPCISIFFSSKWAAWYIPDSNIFNMSVYDDPVHIAKYATHMLCLPNAEIKKTLSIFYKKLEEVSALIKNDILPNELLSVFEMGQEVVTLLKNMDHTFYETFAKGQDYYVSSLKQVMNRKVHNSLNNKQFILFLQKLMDELKDNNFYKYLGYIARRYNEHND